jgi:hypothetical protein
MRRTKIFLFVALVALIVVPAAWALRFTDDSYHPPTGETGKAYSWSFTGAGGCGPALPYQYRVLNGAPPPGLTLDKSGLVHGIPTQAGSYSFWVELSDENPPSAPWCIPSTAQREFTFTIVPGLTIVQRQSSLGGAALTDPYRLQLTATGPGTWSIVSGALPAGIGLDSSNGLISGTPTAAGDFTFKVQISDGTRTDSQTYTLSVVPKLVITPPLAVSTASEVGLPFNLALKATGGRPPYVWSAAGLPDGVTLDTSTGVLTGVPTTGHNVVVKATVTDALGLIGTTDVNLTVASKVAIIKSLKPAKVGKAYTARVTIVGGVKPFTYRLVSGKLPAGIHFLKATGTFTGKPSKAGTSRLTVEAFDKLHQAARAILVLKVNA